MPAARRWRSEEPCCRTSRGSSGNAMLAPDLKSGAGVCPYSVSCSIPPIEGDGAPQGACPGLLTGPPDCSGEPGDPGPDAQYVSARTLRRATAAFPAFAFYG